ncbi:threonine synthase [Salmonella enterica subsp. arizonae]|nr:threonine synthase [Salmonella enterica subsp. arizonae]
MKLYNLKDHNEQVSFAQAVTQGLGKQQGLFFPHDLPEFSLTEIDEMLNQDFVSRSAKILSAFIGDEIPQEILEERIRAAFAFPAPVAQVESDVGCLELFHGPTLAFKDFGGRFMAQMLTHISGDKPVTILTATSGDTAQRLLTRSMVWKMCGSSFSIRAARSARCRKNCSVRWVVTLKLLRSTAILMLVRRW